MWFFQISLNSLIHLGQIWCLTQERPGLSSFSSDGLNTVSYLIFLACSWLPKRSLTSPSVSFCQSLSHLSFDSLQRKVTQQHDGLANLWFPLVCFINIYSKVFLWLKGNAHLLSTTKKPGIERKGQNNSITITHYAEAMTFKGFFFIFSST